MSDEKDGAAKSEEKSEEGASETKEQTEIAEAEAKAKEEAKGAIPEEEWQKRVEKVKKEATEEAVKNIAEKLGVKPEEKEEDPMKSLTSTVGNLQEDLKKSKWEAKHPWVLHEDNEEKWNKVNEEPRYATLTYEERMTQAGITESKEEPDSKSVPAFNKVIPKGTLKEVEEWRKNQNKDIWNTKD